MGFLRITSTHITQAARPILWSFIVYALNFLYSQSLKKEYFLSSGEQANRYASKGSVFWQTESVQSFQASPISPKPSWCDIPVLNACSEGFHGQCGKRRDGTARAHLVPPASIPACT